MTNRRHSPSLQPTHPTTSKPATPRSSTVSTGRSVVRAADGAKRSEHSAPATRRKATDAALGRPVGKVTKVSRGTHVSKVDKRGARDDRGAAHVSPNAKAKPKAQPAARPASGTASKSHRKAGAVQRGSSLPMYREPKRSRSKASCTACGLCCSYVAIEIDSPASVKQATQLLWYVYHEGVSLYDNDDEWMVQFDTTCIHLQPDYRCGIYETRPHICREFSEQDCEVNTGDDGRTFYNATEFLDHLRTTRPRIYARVMKGFAPPVEPQRTRLAPFEHRFQAVVSRRKALGV